MTSAAAASRRDLTSEDLDRPIRSVLPELARGSAALGRLGILTPRQALFYLPFRYDDFSDLRPLGDLVADEKQSARVRVVSMEVEPGFRRRPQRVIAQLSDLTGTAEAIWFGKRYVERRLEPGAEIVVSGKVIFSDVFASCWHGFSSERCQLSMIRCWTQSEVTCLSWARRCAQRTSLRRRPTWLRRSTGSPTMSCWHCS